MLHGANLDVRGKMSIIDSSSNKSSATCSVASTYRYTFTSSGRVFARQRKNAGFIWLYIGSKTEIYRCSTVLFWNRNEFLIKDCLIPRERVRKMCEELKHSVKIIYYIQRRKLLQMGCTCCCRTHIYSNQL